MSAYPGGKGGSGVYQRIIRQIPPHATYIEPFLGGGAVLRHKLPARESYGIDLDAAAVARVEREIGGLPGLTLSVGDGRDFLAARRWTGEEFVYVDPPYLLDVRAARRCYYTNEMHTAGEHRDLLTLLQALPCWVMISGYASDLYRSTLVGWREVHYRAMTRGGYQADEVLWCNYAEPADLHDYRFAGGDYRERERLKRRGQRWRKRLAGLDALERHALIDAVLDHTLLTVEFERALGRRRGDG